MNCLARRKKFKNKHPAWADPNEKKLDEPVKVGVNLVEDDDNDPLSDAHSVSSSDDDDDYELVAGEVRSKRISLETKELSYRHLTNLNNDRSFNGSVKQVQFNPKSKMALVALAKGQLDLFEVDGERNRYIQNIKLPYVKQPYCAFKPDGNSIVISADNFRGNFYTYDMVTATTKRYSLKVGQQSKEMTDFRIHDDYMATRLEGSPEVSVVSSRTYENLFTLKLNEPAKSIQFKSSSNDIFIAGLNANIYVWDLRKTTLCKHRFQDEGSVSSTSLAISEAANLLSVGSDCGIVNSYALDTCLASKFPTPTRTYANLKTPIDILGYNHSGELLLMSSSQEPHAFRMVHAYSGTVYKNFPVPQKRYGRLLSADFSPLSGYLTLGCSNGRAYLCRIPYYKAY